MRDETAGAESAADRELSREVNDVSEHGPGHLTYIYPIWGVVGPRTSLLKRAFACAHRSTNEWMSRPARCFLGVRNPPGTVKP